MTDRDQLALFPSEIDLGPEPTETGVDVSADDRALMAECAGEAVATMAKGTGTVTAVDATAGTITIAHDPIPEANWPAMTMGFKASPQVAQGVKVGDKVAFDLKLEGSAGEITTIAKQ